MKIPFSTALEHYKELKKRKHEMVETIIRNNLDSEQLQKCVLILKNTQKAMDEIYNTNVDADFMKKK